MAMSSTSKFVANANDYNNFTIGSSVAIIPPLGPKKHSLNSVASDLTAVPYTTSVVVEVVVTFSSFQVL
jgi:hypothetical protein